MDSSSIHEGTFRAVVLACPVDVKVTIVKTWRTLLDFSLKGSSYNFTIDKWRSRHLTGFLQRFHEHRIRDRSTYGTVETDDEGLVQTDMTFTQKLNCVLQAVRDVMRCLDMIVNFHKRSVLDYAVWYREKHPEAATYAESIALITCHCIVHADFLAPNVRWDVVQFADEQL